jgi:hypothetical protein
MKKLLITLMSGIALIGCSKSGGDAYIGKWRNANSPTMTIEVTKHDGGSGYTVTRYDGNMREIEAYTGVADGDTIVLSSVFGTIPLKKKGDQISVQLMQGCYEANCVLWNKIK